jgi:pilus assembly protein CpaF
MFGPLEPLLSDPAITEIMMNGHREIYVERHGAIERVDAQFDSEAQLLALIQMIAEPLGAALSESTPILDLRLSDGSLVHIVGRPIALDGPAVTIRKLLRQPVSPETLVGYGSLSAPMLDFLRACVAARLNILIAGGNGAGKTTIFNLLAGMIPPDERIVACEGVGQIRLPGAHLVRLEARPANLEGKGEIRLKHLLESAAKMRPDRVLVNEITGDEMGSLLMLLTSGIDGCLMVIHANSVRDALLRLEMFALASNPSSPLLGLREQIAGGIDLVLSQQKLRDGVRRMLAISEVVGLEGGTIQAAPIFEFVQGDYRDGRILGDFTATGYVPACAAAIEAAGIALPDGIFTPGGQ